MVPALSTRPATRVKSLGRGGAMLGPCVGQEMNCGDVACAEGHGVQDLSVSSPRAAGSLAIRPQRNTAARPRRLPQNAMGRPDKGNSRDFGEVMPSEMPCARQLRPPKL